MLILFDNFRCGVFGRQFVVRCFVCFLGNQMSYTICRLIQVDVDVDVAVVKQV